MLNFPRWKILLVSLVCLAGIVTALPNGFTEQSLEGYPDWLPKNQINLGLDLQGGVHLLIEVDVDSVLDERLDNLVSDVRSELSGARIGYLGLGTEGNAVTFRLRDPEDRPQALSILRELAQPLTTNLIGPTTSDLEVEAGDGGRVRVALTEQGVVERRRSAVDQAIEIVRRRIDELGTREPTVQRQGENRILLQVPGAKNSQEIKDVLSKVAKMTFHMVDMNTSVEDARRGRLPGGSGIFPYPNDPQRFGEIVLRKRALIRGEDLADASQGFDQNGFPIVNFRFNAKGGKIFADTTKNNVGNLFAIVLDGEVISAPRIRTAILGGAGYIEGNFTVESASELALLLRAGELNAPLEFVEERTVGPDLGSDSIAAGRAAALIGFVAVIVFIIAAYGWFGVAANAALLLNMAMIAGALSTLGATLTLPGIAGIVLTIGMAVDANVLVFERIREEIRAGRTPVSAMDSGYRQALSTILDANITTLIAAVILFEFGSGPVKGFAVTLMFGIVTSVFTAVTVTRMFLALWLRRARPQTLPI